MPVDFYRKTAYNALVILEQVKFHYGIADTFHIDLLAVWILNTSWVQKLLYRFLTASRLCYSKEWLSMFSGENLDSLFFTPSSSILTVHVLNFSRHDLRSPNRTLMHSFSTVQIVFKFESDTPPHKDIPYVSRVRPFFKFFEAQPCADRSQ